MNERSRETIREYLQHKEVQERILASSIRARNEAPVTIKHAASLYNLTENQLRDWGEYGLLTPERPEHVEGTKGRRLYKPAQLDQLAIITELMNAGYSRGEILSELRNIQLAFVQEWQNRIDVRDRNSLQQEQQKTNSTPIDTFVEKTYDQLFERYFISRIIYFMLMLITSEIPDTITSLILPRYEVPSELQVNKPEELQQLGKCLVGWLRPRRMLCTFLTLTPKFDYPTDYRVERIQVPKEDDRLHTPSLNAVWIVIQRAANKIYLSKEVIETLNHLLALLYEDRGKWDALFDSASYEWLDPFNNFPSETSLNSTHLHDLANMLVRLGGKTAAGKDRWEFCSILLPDNTQFPIRQRKLEVCVQSERSPHKVKVIILPEQHADSPSMRAFHDRRIIYRSRISDEDTTIAYRDIEKSIRSVIAIPIGGEHDAPRAIIYVASAETHAFPQNAQRILRLVSRFVGEFLDTYMARQKMTEDLIIAIKRPDIFDQLFKDFLSEREFEQDIENILQNIQKRQFAENTLSIIAIEIDKQIERSLLFGEELARKLSREVGIQIQNRLRALFASKAWELYHIHTDRFYIILKDVSLETAIEKAERLRQYLKASYEVDTLLPPAQQTSRLSAMPDITEVTVRLGVTSYSFNKLEEVLERYPAEYAIDEVRSSVFIFWLDKALEDGKIEGDIVMAWNQSIRGFARYGPNKAPVTETE